uniref:hypothetical protein n=1 Tax=Cardinium endosymbiont of Bemisia tabaci TaxID=672794 RepID=UPI000442CF37|nr:hypothetical protein [Cardinium endosymbiont of Bemisia tabaci]CDG50389.1 Hypothetical protein CHV_p024 [Cardinium endosymbiont cBtQ1 of Bemisia tabaci]
MGKKEIKFPKIYLKNQSTTIQESMITLLKNTLCYCFVIALTAFTCSQEAKQRPHLLKFSYTDGKKSEQNILQSKVLETGTEEANIEASRPYSVYIPEDEKANDPSDKIISRKGKIYDQNVKEATKTGNEEKYSAVKSNSKQVERTSTTETKEKSMLPYKETESLLTIEQLSKIELHPALQKLLLKQERRFMLSHMLGPITTRTSTNHQPDKVLALVPYRKPKSILEVEQELKVRQLLILFKRISINGQSDKLEDNAEKRTDKDYQDVSTSDKRGYNDHLNQVQEHERNKSVKYNQGFAYLAISNV